MKIINVFYAIEINTGQVLWTLFTREAVQTIPILVDGKVIFNAGNSLYIILNAATGDLVHAVTCSHPLFIRAYCILVLIQVLFIV